MIGSYVCRVHGGTSRQALNAARFRRTEAVILRAFEADYGRWLREWAAWQAQRAAITAEILGIPLGDVQAPDIWFCSAWHGRPGGPDTAPTMRHDRRYLANRPADYEARTARW
jgi:hypothetical protein